MMLLGLDLAMKVRYMQLTIVSKLLLVENTRLTLMCYICDPDAADLDTVGFQPFVHLVPHGLVQFLQQAISALFWTSRHSNYLWESISMCCNNCDISFLRRQVVERGVLSDGKVERVLLAICSRERVLSDICTWQCMLLNSEI